jgi:hypothetical protein
MNSDAKAVADVRFAKGEISESEYRRILEVIGANNRSTKNDVIENLKNIGKASVKAIKDVNEGKPILNNKNYNIPTINTALQVDDDLAFFDSYFEWKGNQYPYSSVTAISYFEKQTSTAVSTHSAKFEIYVNNCLLVSKSSIGFILGKTDKSERIRVAYQYVSEKTRGQRYKNYRTQFSTKGYVKFGDAKIYSNGNVELNGKVINIISSNKNGNFLIGTSYKNYKSERNSPYEIVIGESGTGFFSSKIKFTLEIDQDVQLMMLNYFKMIGPEDKWMKPT